MPNIPARYNAAPTQDIAVVRFNPKAGRRSIDPLRWGLVPPWAKEIKIGARFLNARAETVAETNAFRTAFRKRRCLVPATGFYEWQKRPDGTKQPFWITRDDHAPFAFAGLASEWGTCAIVTTEATPALADIHARMPVMLDPDAEERWLDADLSLGAAHALLRPFAATSTFAVSGAVNDARYDGPACLEPAPPPPPTLF